MRIFCPVFFVLVFFHILSAQDGFNKRYGAQLPTALFYNLLFDDDKLVLYGVGIDSKQYIVIGQMDTTGILLNSKTYHDSLGGNFTANLNYGLVKTPGGDYVIVGEIGGPMWTFWMEIDPNLEVIKKKKYFDPNVFGALQERVVVAPEGYMVSGQKSKQDYTSDIYVMKIDLSGNKVWEKSYGKLNVNDVDYTIIRANDNCYIVSGFHSNPAGTPLPQWWAQSWIFAIDSLGNKLWEFEGPVNHEINAVGINQTPDGGWIYGSGTFELIASDDWGSTSKVVCRDSNMNLLWETPISPTVFSTNRIRDIKPSPDGAYVVIGEWTTQKVPGQANYGGGSITKINLEGELLWSKLFTGYPQQPNGTANYLGGVVVLPSGSIVATGYSQRFHPSYVAPQGWVIKISPDGCVEDTLCLTSGVEDMETLAPGLKVFPNPAHDHVVFQTLSATETDVHITIADVMGKIVWDYSGGGEALWQASAYPRGVYIYRLERGGMVNTGKVILQH